jgi:hypothetical protein
MAAHCNNGGCTKPVYRGKECYRCWLGTKWDSMKARVENKRNHYPQWAGISLGISRADFIVWGFYRSPPADMKHPSIDRIKSALGYIDGNIQWLEARQNSRGGRKNVPLTHRYCTRCGKTKPLTSEFFNKNSSRWKMGFQAYCRPCQKDYSREHA